MSESGLGPLLDRLFREVTIAKACLTIFRGIRKRFHDDPSLATAANNFFAISLFALITQSQLLAAKLFDKRQDTLTVYTVLEKADSTAGEFSNVEPQEVRRVVLDAQKTIESKQVTLQHLKERRDNLIAHLNFHAALDPDVIFKDAELTYADLEDILDMAGKILNDISGLYRDAENHLELIGLSDYNNALDMIVEAKRMRVKRFGGESEA